MISNALEYARKHVEFWQSSPIVGAFDDARYPFIRKPLLSLDNIHVKETVVYGPTQSFKTVFAQIATAYRLAVHQCSVLITAQSDDDVDEFSKVKMRPFIERLPHLIDTVSAKPTINLIQWPNHELILSGPGENASESKSVRFWHSDEAHRYNHGRLASLANRCGQRWDRHMLHTTTAANAGTEIDSKYFQGDQSEWHVRCIHCNALFQPLWEEESRRVYNGHRVLQWTESGSDTETLDSIHYACPHCDKPINNTPRNRVLMDDGADYVAQNPKADKSLISFRWNAFASRFKPLRDLFLIYRQAIESAKLGDFNPYMEWKKKQCVLTWDGEIPQVGNATIGRDHSLSQIEVIEGDLVIGSCDIQSEGGFHIWALADVWSANGDSKRLTYDKLASFDDLRAWQGRHGVIDFDQKKHRHPFLCADHGHLQSDTFAACARYGWLALKSTDEDGFSHVIKRRNLPDIIVDKPWSTVRAGNPLIGKAGQQTARLCATRLWSKPTMYSMLYRLSRGETTRKYGIASDISANFTDQIASYMPSSTTDKKTGGIKPFWRKIKKQDHAFICASQSLLMAMIHGVYSAPER